MIEKLIGVGVGAITLATGAYYVTDYTEVRPIIKKEYRLAQEDITKNLQQLQEQIQSNSRANVYLQFQVLSEKQKITQAPLSFEEQRQLCSAAEILDYSGVQGCGH